MTDGIDARRPDCAGVFHRIRFKKHPRSTKGNSVHETNPLWAYRRCHGAPRSPMTRALQFAGRPDDAVCSGGDDPGHQQGPPPTVSCADVEVIFAPRHHGATRSRHRRTAILRRPSRPVWGGHFGSTCIRSITLPR